MPEPRPYLPALARLYRPLDVLAWPLVRLAAGAMLIPHGAQKLFGLWGGDIAKTIAGFAQLGLEPAGLLAWYIGCLEFFGGILLVIGLFTRPVAVLVAGFMAMAAFYVHWANGFFWTKAGFEYPLMWMLLAIAIAIRGAGPLSVDAKIGREV